MMRINPNIPNRRRRIVVVAVYEVCLGLTASLPFRQLFFAEPLSLTTLFNRRPLLQHLKSTLCEMHPNWCGHFQSGAHALCKFSSVLFEGEVGGTPSFECYWYRFFVFLFTSTLNQRVQWKNARLFLLNTNFNPL